jgi:hypothetical protein
MAGEKDMTDVIRESSLRAESPKSDHLRHFAQEVYRANEVRNTGRERDSVVRDAPPLAFLPPNDALNIAKEIQDGKIDNIVSNTIGNIAKQQFRQGGREAVMNLVSDVNEWLSLHNSNFKVEPGVPSSKGEGLALTITDTRNSDKQKNVCDIDLNDKSVNAVAAGLADSFRRGAFTEADRVLLENKFTEAYQSGGANASNQLLTDINSELEAKGSDFRLKSGATKIKSLTAQELQLENQRTGKSNEVTDFDRDDPARPVQAAAIAESLKNGGVMRMTRIELENAFKEAYLNEGAKGPNKLLAQINEELKQLGSDFSLERRPSADGKQVVLGLKDKKTDDARQIADFSVTAPYTRFDNRDIINFMPDRPIEVIEIKDAPDGMCGTNEEVLRNVRDLLNKQTEK